MKAYGNARQIMSIDPPPSSLSAQGDQSGRGSDFLLTLASLTWSTPINCGTPLFSSLMIASIHNQSPLLTMI